MKILNQTLLASGIALALGSTGTWANPNNHAKDVYKNDQTAWATSDQSGNTSPQANEYSTATQKNDYSSASADDAAANNYSQAISDRSSASADDAAANNGSHAISDRSDNSYADADDKASAANNHSTATTDNSDHSDNSYADADDKAAAANNHSRAGVANGSGSGQTNDGNAYGSYADGKSASTNVGNATTDNSYADVSGTGAAANGGGDAHFQDSHDTDNSYAKSDGSYTAAANNHSTAEVHMAVANSYLDGYVTHNTTTFDASKYGDIHYEGNNNASGAVAGASGVINFSQNTGQNALTQQSVSTQASLTVN